MEHLSDIKDKWLRKPQNIYIKYEMMSAQKKREFLFSLISEK